MNELLVGAEAIRKRFRISRARLRVWQASGAPIYRRGTEENGPYCADYCQLLDWEQTRNALHRGRLSIIEDAVTTE